MARGPLRAAANLQSLCDPTEMHKYADAYAIDARWQDRTEMGHPPTDRRVRDRDPALIPAPAGADSKDFPDAGLM